MTAMVAFAPCTLVTLPAASAGKQIAAFLDAGRIAQVPDQENAKPVQDERSSVVPADEDFDRWVFEESIAGRDPMGPDEARRRLEYLLESAIIYIDQLCGLSQDQMTKLRLAGRGDINHFFSRVDERRRAFQAIRNDRAKVQELMEDLRPLQEAWVTDPLLEDSLFSKTLRSTLRAAQLAKVDQFFAEIKRTDHQDLIQAFVKEEGRNLGLNDDQRHRLNELLLKETRPSRRLGPYRHWGLLLQVSKIPESRIKLIFDEAQWDKLHSELQAANRVPPNVRDVHL
jgi:hypothetical protein